MANPFLLGFGKAFAGLGQDLEQRDLLNYQRSLLAKQQERQNATDALSRLVTLQGIGGTELGANEDPMAAVSSLTNANAMRSGGAIPNSALGVDDSETPSFYGAPRVVKLPNMDGTTTNVLLDPSRTPQALAERKFATQQRFMDQRQDRMIDAQNARADAKEKAAADLETQKQTARTLAATKQARADYNTLKSEFPRHPLVQAAFDPDNAANYAAALKDQEGLRTLQVQQQGDWAPSGAIDATTGEPILYNKKTGEKKIIQGAAPKPGAGNAGQNAPQMAAARSNLEASMKIMDDFEGKLKSGEASFSPFAATEGALASSPAALNAKGLTGGVESYLANQASSRLQQNDPELARYLTAKKYVAEAILNTHKRPNQTQYEIEQEIAGAGPNASPMQIDMAADRRRRMYNEVFDNPSAGAVAPKGGAKTSGVAAKYRITPSVP